MMRGVIGLSFHLRSRCTSGGSVQLAPASVHIVTTWGSMGCRGGIPCCPSGGENLTYGGTKENRLLLRGGFIPANQNQCYEHSAKMQYSKLGLPLIEISKSVSIQFTCTAESFIFYGVENTLPYITTLQIF
jgi:hypothetical protein